MMPRRKATLLAGIGALAITCLLLFLSTVTPFPRAASPRTLSTPLVPVSLNYPSLSKVFVKGARLWQRSDILPRGNGRDDSDSGWLTQESNPSIANNKNTMAVEGRNMVCFMDAPASSPQWPQSEYTDTAELDTYGWTYSIKTVSQSDLDDTGLSAAFAALHIDTDPSAWIELQLQHTGNPQWPATYAIYQNYVNFQDGVLLAMQNYGPQWQIKMHNLNVPANKITPLSRWSDLAFLGMQKYIAENNLRLGSPKLNHVFRVSLQNSDVVKSLLLISEKTDPDDPGAVGDWPGLTYPINSHQSLATLSVPNGKGVGYLFAQHKEAMGIRGTDLVRIFDCPLEGENGDRADRWCLYFHVKDGPVGRID